MLQVPGGRAAEAPGTPEQPGRALSHATNDASSLPRPPSHKLAAVLVSTVSPSFSRPPKIVLVQLLRLFLAPFDAAGTQGPRQRAAQSWGVCKSSCRVQRCAGGQRVRWRGRGPARPAAQQPLACALAQRRLHRGLVLTPDTEQLLGCLLCTNKPCWLSGTIANTSGKAHGQHHCHAVHTCCCMANSGKLRCSLVPCAGRGGCRGGRAAGAGLGQGAAPTGTGAVALYGRCTVTCAYLDSSHGTSIAAVRQALPGFKCNVFHAQCALRASRKAATAC